MIILSFLKRKKIEKVRKWKLILQSAILIQAKRSTNLLEVLGVWYNIWNHNIKVYMRSFIQEVNKKNKSYLIFLKSNKNNRLNLCENEKEKYIRIIIDKILNLYKKLRIFFFSSVEFGCNRSVDGWEFFKSTVDGWTKKSQPSHHY